MRIAYMLTSLGRGGAERQVIALAERMAARGHHVVLMVLGPPDVHEWPNSLEVIRLHMRKSAAGICVGLVQGHRAVRRFRPDIIHSHTFPANIAARILQPFISAGVALSTIHNVYEGGWGRTAFYRLTDWLSVHTTAVSEAVLKCHVEAGSVPKRKCSVITNGIDCDLFRPSVVRRNELRSQMKVQGGFVWLAAGRLTAAKDYPNLLRAFSLVRANFADAQLWIAGEGTLSEQRSLYALAETAGISQSVRWLGLRDDMTALLDASDAFVQSSAWEGMPLAIGEAMAMEKTVVATDVGGVHELVGSAGVVVPPNDPKALAGEMLGVMRKSEQERWQLGHDARERIQRSFDINVKADEWQAFYGELLGSRPATSKYAASKAGA